MRSSRCRDDGEMYEKGLTLAVARTSAISLRASVHFPAFLAGRRTRAVHFPSFPAASRALRPIPCRGTISCKDLREVHVERLAGCPFRRALPPFSCTQACTSPVSLHEFASMQGFGGSARHRAGIEGKCTASCRNRGELHGCSAAAWFSHAFLQNFATLRNARVRDRPGGLTCQDTTRPFCQAVRPEG